ncbi:MAG: hypothetical protein JNL50_07405 [Phycisphaerae bacterium]|nr:hypothetical protein [Phycisphaerae bacterium]
MTAEIEIAGEFGGPDTDAVDPIFWKVLKPAAVGIPIESLDARVRQLSLLLRVSGAVKQYEGEPVECVKFGRRREWISVDLLLWHEDWRGRTSQEIARVLADRIREVPRVVAQACRAKKVAVEEAVLQSEMDTYASAVVALAEAREPGV